jgi:hypothetical protein
MSNLDEYPNQEARVAGVATKLRIDAATAQVLELFAAMGVQAILVKGASLVGWLYPEDSAHYSDADILVRPSDEERAFEALVQLGFERALDDSSMPPWWREHASDWRRAQDAVAVDLHRRLVGIGVDAATAWPLLTAERETMTVGGYPAPVLAPPARLVHVTLHAAQDGPRKGGKALLHLQRSIERFDDGLWRAATDLAVQLQATDAFAAGLRLTPDGAALAERLGIPAVRSVDAALRAGSGEEPALSFEQLARASGPRARAAMVAHKLFPPREFLVHWDPRAGESRGRLALARVRRPFWVLGGAPKALRAWWRARREVRS